MRLGACAARFLMKAAASRPIPAFVQALARRIAAAGQASFS